MTLVPVADFVAWELSEEGTAYKDAPGRCDPASPFHDCSGLPCASVRAGGGDVGCLDTYAITAWIRASGKAVSFEEARKTKGYVMLLGGPSRAANHNGHAHAVTSLGDGRTIEAADTAEGVVIGHTDGRGFTDFGPFPGVDYSGDPGLNPGPTNPGEARDMGMTAAIMLPDAHVQNKAPWLNRYPFVGAVVQPDLTTDLVGFNGCIIDKGIWFNAMSILHLGVLKAPIESFSVVNATTVVGLAGDGGSFTVTLHPHYI